MASEFTDICATVRSILTCTASLIADISCRYASDLTPDQKDALLDVIRARPHPTISSEVRREIVNSVERGAPRPEDGEDIKMQ